LLSRLGEGGMGTVYLADDRDGRRVAVKVIKPEHALDPEFRARFRGEVERARRVPPFCTAEVLDADPDHETPYLVVEFVDGPSLAEVVREQGPLSAANVHGVAIGVATALVAIHGAGVIHRDLKPANVLFKLGTPKVIDFGIARGTDPTREHTRPEQMVGTIAYMAPERFDPARHRVSPAADVFAWGVVVTYAATGHLPFAGDSPIATAGMILTQPPELDGLNGLLRDLVAAALDKDPGKRPTAAQLLDRLLAAGQAAGPVDPEVRRAAHAARHRVRSRRLLRLTGAACALALAAGVPAGLVVRERSADRDRATAAATRATRTIATDNLVARSRETRPTDPGLSLRLAATAVTLTPDATTRATLAAAIATGYAGELATGKPVEVARYRQDGRLVVLGADDGTLTFWTGTTLIGTARSGNQFLAGAAFSPDGRTLAVTGKRLELWDVHDPAAPRRLGSAGLDAQIDHQQAVEFAGPGRLVTSDTQGVALWDVQDPARPRRTWKVPAADGSGAAAMNTRRGLYLAATDEADLVIWAGKGTAKPRPVGRIDNLGWVDSIAIEPAGKLAAVAVSGLPIRLYDLTDPARPESYDIPGSSTQTVDLAFSPDGTGLAAADSERHVTRWDVRFPTLPKPAGTYDGHGGTVTGLVYAPDGGTLLTTSAGVARTALLWRDRTALAPDQVTSLEQAGDVESVDISASDTLAVQVGADQGRHTVQSWDVRDPAHPRAATAPVLLPTGQLQMAVRMSREQPAHVFAARSLWDITRPAVPRRLPPATCCYDGKAVIYDFDATIGLAAVWSQEPGDDSIAIYRTMPGADPRRVSTIPAAHGPATFVRGRHELVMSASDNSLTRWDLRDPAHPRRIDAFRPAGPASHIAVSGDTIAYWTTDGFHLRRAGTDSLVVPLGPGDDPEGEVWGTSLSPDGTLLAVTTGVRTELWSVAQPEAAFRVASVPGDFDGSGFSPANPILATGDRTYIRLWNVERTSSTLRDPRPEACRLGGGLTEAEWPRYVKDLPYAKACA
jgi:WD40 repeat protein